MMAECRESLIEWEPWLEELLKPRLAVEYRDGEAVGYRYGDELEIARMWLAGGYKTEAEARAAWERRDSFERS